MSYVWLGGIFAVGAALFLVKEFFGGMVGLYRIVPVNEAHIRIFKNKKQIFSSRTGASSYWYIPFMTKLHKLPLCNLAVSVDDIKLNDIHMAKFLADIMCFVNIDNLELAVERLILTDTSHELGFDFQRLSTDLRAIVESIGRTTTTKQSIEDIYKDRSTLDQIITKEVEAVFPKWGIKLVDLELKEIKDAAGSSIIQDIEKLRAAELRRNAEIKLAETNRDAQVKAADYLREAEIAKAKSEEAYRRQQIEKDRQIALAEQKKNEEVAEALALVNTRQIAATRELEFGKAEIQRQVAEKNAEAVRLTLKIEAEGEADKITRVGNANADVIRLTKTAEAEGTEKLAAAMQKFNDTSIQVKVLDIQRDVMIEKFKALGSALSQADLKLILSGDQAQKFFGLDLTAMGGAQIGQFLEESGIKSTLESKIKKDDKKSDAR